MKKEIHIIIALFLFCITLSIQAQNNLDSIDVERMGLRVKKSHSGILFDFYINKIQYYGETNTYIMDHFGPAFKIGGYKNNFFITTFFKPWTTELQKSLIKNSDTIPHYSDVNPIRVGFEFGYLVETRYLEPISK